MHVCTHRHTYLHTYEENRGGILVQTPAHSALMNMLEHGGSTLPNRPPSPPFPPRSISLRLHCIGKGVSNQRWDAEGRLSPCLYRTIFDDSVARHTSVFTDCRFMNKVDAQASAQAVCGFTISHSRSYIYELTDNSRCPKRRSKVCSNITAACLCDEIYFSNENHYKFMY